MASHSRVGEILLKAKVIDELQLRSARAHWEKWGGRIGKSVAELGLADEDTIADAICRATNLQRVSLGNLSKDPAALARFDVKFAEENGVFPVAVKDNGKTLIVAMADPTDLPLFDVVAQRARIRVQTAVASETEIQHAILRYYKGQDPARAVQSRARQAFRHASEEIEVDEGSDEEFKITDMAGKTMVRHVDEIVRPAAAVPPAPPAEESPEASAASLLDELISSTPSSAFSAEDLQKLQALKLNQEKSAVVLRAITELLVSKGYATQKELAARIKQ